VATRRVPVSHAEAAVLVSAGPRGVLVVENKSSQSMYVLEGAGASSTKHTVMLGTDDYWESPKDKDGNIFQGVVTARLAAADVTGAAMVTVR
jgi:hypothetical protein